MPRKKNLVPAYLSKHPSGNARVRIDGKDVWLGVAGSPESLRKYAEILARAGLDPVSNRGNRGMDSEDVGPTIDEVILAFITWAETYYVQDGRPTTELSVLNCAFKPLFANFGQLPIREFGPKALKQLQSKYIAAGHCRNTVNTFCCKVRRLFKWAVSEQIIPQSVLEALKTVDGLREGKSEARDNAPRQAISAERIVAVYKHVSQRTQDLIYLQFLCGARGGELLKLTTAMVDQTGEIWEARLVKHKTAHHGKERRLQFAGHAQEILKRYLDANAPDRRLFPLTVGSYRQAVRRGCERAFGMPAELREIPKSLESGLRKKRLAEAVAWRAANVWYPHLLRHTSITHVAELLTDIVAQHHAGHEKITMTGTYTRAAVEASRDAARALDAVAIAPKIKSGI